MEKVSKKIVGRERGKKVNMNKTKRIMAKKVKTGDKIFLYGKWLTIYGFYASKNKECIFISLKENECIEIKSNSIISIKRD